MSIKEPDGGQARGLQPQVFWGALAIVLILLIAAMVAGDSFENIASDVQSSISTSAGWFYVLAVNSFLAFAIYLAFSRFGNIRLGTDDSKPEFSTLSWFAMLFSAGMGIGLVFFGVAEPIYHYLAPPIGEGETVEAARQSMSTTFLHWGFHAWAIYAVVGLAVAYFAFRHNLPLSIRSTFYPLLGERVHGICGHLIDFIAIGATLCGVATSLGLGAQQIHSGLTFLFGLTNSNEPFAIGLSQNQGIQILLIGSITAVATISVVLGLRAGILRLSKLNIGAAGLLLLFVLVTGPTVFLLSSLIQNIGEYLSVLPQIATWTESFSSAANPDGEKWQNSWTVFYWGWWISWSPFVGIFIARISKGRTVRQFIGGVLLAPAVATFVWLSVFGGTALHGALSGDDSVAKAVASDVPTSLFVMLQQLPAGEIACGLATLVILVFFVTSSDSASLVIDTIASGGNPDPPKWQRIFWAVLEGAIAATLLVLGGLTALQTASIATGLPFAIVLLFMCLSLLKGLRQERQ
ncbi:MAG: choline/glycine/proline betaine transport protein [Verrucomicrobiales bacterium]